MVQSASVEDNMAEHQQPVPLEAIIPADTEAETQRSVPLPPPIIPETEDFSPGSVSDASSGYVSTSISMATLSDVYTLSWDLPPAFEAAPDEEDEGKPETEEGSPDQSKAWKLLGLPEEERTEQDETNQTPPVRLEEQQEPDPGLGDQTEGNVDSGSGSEPAGEDDHAESQQRASAQVDHTPEEEAGAQAPPEPEGGHHPVKPPPQEPPGSDRTPDPAPEPNGDSALHISPNKPALSESPAPLSGSARPSSPVTDQARHAAPPRTSSSAAAAANPFKIQKVKTSDLKSFQRIVGEEGGDAAKVDRAGSVGAGLNLPAPAEGLEMISDSEEGDDAASAVLPDWLKEGEFVTVGANKSGTVRYVGPTDFAAGTWVGVELEVPAGKNDGSVGGKHYFHCNPGYGVLIRPDRVARGGGATKRRRQQQKRRSANLSGSSPNLAALTVLAKGEAGVAGRHKGENRKSWNT